jgi:hypothetical protein
MKITYKHVVRTIGLIVLLSISIAAITSDNINAWYFIPSYIGLAFLYILLIMGSAYGYLCYVAADYVSTEEYQRINVFFKSKNAYILMACLSSILPICAGIYLYINF